METSQIVQFLEAVDAELQKHAQEGERLDLYLLGRAALILRYGLSLATKDVDMVTRTETPELEAKAFELFGKGTPNAMRWGLYLEGVPPGLPPVPGSYRRLSVELPGNWMVLRPKQIVPLVRGDVQVHVVGVPRQSVKPDGMPAHDQTGDSDGLQFGDHLGKAHVRDHSNESSRDRLPWERYRTNSGWRPSSSLESGLASRARTCG
jgi:hypothetical protein